MTGFQSSTECINLQTAAAKATGNLKPAKLFQEHPFAMELFKKIFHIETLNFQAKQKLANLRRDLNEIATEVQNAGKSIKGANSPIEGQAKSVAEKARTLNDQIKKYEDDLAKSTKKADKEASEIAITFNNAPNKEEIQPLIDERLAIMTQSSDTEKYEGAIKELQSKASHLKSQATQVTSSVKRIQGDSPEVSKTPSDYQAPGNTAGGSFNPAD